MKRFFEALKKSWREQPTGDKIVLFVSLFALVMSILKPG